MKITFSRVLYLPEPYVTAPLLLLHNDKLRGPLSVTFAAGRCLQPGPIYARLAEGQNDGLTWGNWYCAPEGRRCHYLGHHESFHHMLYWDGHRRVSVAMVSNNALSPALQQRVQRALVAVAEKRGAVARRELASPLPAAPVVPGNFKFPSGETVSVVTKGQRVGVVRGGITYLAFPVGGGIRYVPGLDVYLAGAEGGGLHWLSLYEDLVGERAQETKSDVVG